MKIYACVRRRCTHSLLQNAGGNIEQCAFNTRELLSNVERAARERKVHPQEEGGGEGWELWKMRQQF